MLVKGDKLVVTKDVASFLKKGEIVEVVEVNGDMISFSFGDGMHRGLMNFTEYEEHFEKYVEPKKAPTLTDEYIDEIIDNSDISVSTVFDKCTVVVCKLPNGFVITESSACVSPENYDKEIGIEICMNRIRDKIWELEGYKLQCELYECDCEDCDCPYDCDECPYDEDEDEEDECLDTDSDCDDCDDLDCPYHPNN